MSVPQLDLRAQHAPLLPAMTEALARIVTTGQAIGGPMLEGFERGLAGYCEAHHAIGVSSGTDALLVALMALGVGPGDEVITSPFTFFATAGCIARVGARPVFVDIQPETFNIDPSKIEAAATPKTKAIIPVHLFGQTADMAPILAQARRRKLAVIEDAAQAIGARENGERAGAIGDVGCLSFYPSKNLSALGDAGACVTNRPDLAELIRMLRVHGEETRYHHTHVGGNFRLDAIQAAILGIKLPHLDAWTDARHELAARYTERLSGLPLDLPAEKPGKHHVFNQYTLRVRDGKREALKRHLAAHGIGHGVYYPVPLHLQACFASLGGKEGDFPEAERAAREVLSLPLFPELTPEQQDEAVNAVREFYA